MDCLPTVCFLTIFTTAFVRDDYWSLDDFTTTLTQVRTLCKAFADTFDGGGSGINLANKNGLLFKTKMVRRSPDSEDEWEWLKLPNAPDESYIHNLLAHVFSKKLGRKKCGKGRLKTDSTLTELELDVQHRVQQMPTQGDCFYFSLVAILLQVSDDLGGDRDEVDFYLTHTVKAFRMFSARATLNDLDLLQTVLLDEHNEAELREAYGGKELTVSRVQRRPRPFLRYFGAVDDRESYPYADATDVANLLQMDVSKHLLFVIFQTKELTKHQSGKAASNQFICQFPGEPSEKLGVVFIRRSGRRVQHYEPILWNIGGKWTHTVSCRLFLTKAFRPLRQALRRSCPTFERYVRDWEDHCEGRDPYVTARTSRVN